MRDRLSKARGTAGIALQNDRSAALRRQRRQQPRARDAKRRGVERPEDLLVPRAPRPETVIAASPLDSEFLRRIHQEGRDALPRVQAGWQVGHTRFMEVGWRWGGRAGPPPQCPFVPKAKALVNGSSERRGVELDATHATPAQIVDAVSQQRLTDSPTPEFGMHQHHAYPGQFRPVNNCRRRASGCAVPFGQKAARRFDGEETFPIAQRLVPAGERAQEIGERQILAAQHANS